MDSLPISAISLQLDGEWLGPLGLSAQGCFGGSLRIETVQGKAMFSRGLAASQDNCKRSP